MERIQALGRQLTAAPSSPKAILDITNWMGFYDRFPPESRELGAQLQQFLKTHQVQQLMLEYIETAEAPVKLIPILQKMNIGHLFYDKDYTKADRGGQITTVTDPWAKIAAVIEISKVDGSVSTMFAAQHCLLGRTLELYGSEELKRLYLPRLQRWDIIGGWGLTEENVGSDASNIETRAVWDHKAGHFLLYGNKRWIGNGHGDVMSVFARDESRNGEVGCFLVDLTAPGVTRRKITGKISFRPVQNMILKFEGVKIPANHRIDGVKGFASVSKVLADSRIMVGWLAVGMQFGIYEAMMQYLTKRKQFEKPLIAFQLIQEKIFKVASRAQASAMIAVEAQKRLNAGTATIGQLALVKGYCSEMLRESAKFGRESLGGNGIIADNQVMKMLVDAEAVYTYEGTYDINLMVAGRELTGVAAFKTR